MDIKKITLAALTLCFLSACMHEGPIISDDANTASSSNASEYKTNVRMEEANYISDSDLARYKENIVEKRRTESSVSYEYRDVRVDELTPLAVNYCSQKNQSKTAQLREIVMRSNHARMATFDCVDLQ